MSSNNMKMSQKIADWMFKHTSFPNGKVPERKSLWFTKGSCVVCVCRPIECLSNMEYAKKYPANCKLTLGYEQFQLCEHHAKQLADVLQQFLSEVNE